MRSPYEGMTPTVPFGQSHGTVTLVEGQTFALSGRRGDVTPRFPHGLFVLDTRVVSRWELTVDGRPIEPLAVQPDEAFAATFVGHAAPAEGRADAELVVLRHRHIGTGMRERITVVNHGLEPVTAAVELRCDVDFAGLFEVKEGHIQDRVRQVASERGALVFTHDAGAVRKTVRVSDPTARVDDDGVLCWEVDLAPTQRWESCVQVTVGLDGAMIEPRFACGRGDDDAVPARRMVLWRTRLPSVRTDDRALTRALTRSADDLGALQITDPEHPDLPIVAAGAPWFMTLFGRDSLLTAWMAMIADAQLARGVLQTLGRLQGQDVQSAREEEPGKILHEVRFGSAADGAFGGAEIYYGSVDATPLFVMLLGELHRWAPDDDVVQTLTPHADRAIEWIERFGDRDGDGYVEYQRSTEWGLANQGWKDSWDAIRHADGGLAEGPIALCEVQGYVYAAYLARAQIARHAGDLDVAERCEGRARDLKARFNADFWVDDDTGFALALDGDKRPVAVGTSNVGHCLWSGIVDVDHAPVVARQLMTPDAFSGFGIRTLFASAVAFNPVSYHNGSVWPHDNAICAAGLARYGFVEDAHRVISAQIRVAQHHDGRLPELFAGFGVADVAVPASYPASCSPQAWAAGAPLLWLRALLRLEPRGDERRVWLHPALPAGIARLSVHGIDVAGVELDVWIERGEVTVEGGQDLEIIRGMPQS